MKTVLLEWLVRWRVRAVDSEVAIDLIWNKDRLTIYPVKLKIGLVQRCKVRAGLELFEREGTLHSDLSGTGGVFECESEKVIDTTHLNVELCLVST